MTERRARMTVDELVSAARSRLQRLDPAAASDAVAAGAVLIDIRSDRQRDRDARVASRPGMRATSRLSGALFMTASA